MKGNAAENRGASDHEWESLILEFLEESRDRLDQLDQDLIALEDHPNDPERLASIFRAIHTIKGSAGLLGFNTLQQVAHAGETILDQLRNGTLSLTLGLSNTLLHMIDGVRTLLHHIEQEKSDQSLNFQPLIQELVSASADATSIRTPSLPTTSIEHSPINPVDNHLKVPLPHLNQLMGYAEELVLVRNQISKQFEHKTDSTFSFNMTQRLNRVTSDLHGIIMKMRMQAVGTIWRKFPRLVHDLGKTLNKDIQLVMSGEETELDKTLLETIRDPLTHLLRNAIDHGIENAENRLKHGKPVKGTIRLNAFQEAGYVVIEISDDGQGIQWERVRQKVIAEKLEPTEKAHLLTEKELASFLFRPGFSTSQQITHLSGRGVGLDVVQSNIEQVSGTLSLKSIPGNGTTFQLRIPLTLAVLPALLLQTRSQTFAVARTSVVELLRLEDNHPLEYFQTIPIYRYRQSLLPLIDLETILRSTQTPQDIASPLNGQYIVVLQVGSKQLGLVVHRVVGSEEVVIKPFGRFFKKTCGFVGATVLGDGQIALILDTHVLADRARLSLTSEQLTPTPSTNVQATAPLKEQYMLFKIYHHEQPFALSISHIKRFEILPSSVIEKSGDQLVMQHQGRVIMLYWLHEWLLLETRTVPHQQSNIAVLICETPDGSIGLLIEETIDIIEESISYESLPAHHGLLGTAVIRNRVTDVIDFPKLVREHHAGIKENL